MNDTMHSEDARISRRFALWSGTALLLVLVAVMALLSKNRPMTTTLAFTIAGVGAAGTLAMAALVARASAYPAWAVRATGAVMAAALLLSVPVAGDPRVWTEDYRLGAWMLPWFVLFIGTSGGRQKEGACAPGHPAAGWIMVGVAAVMSVVLLGAHVIVDAVRGLFAG